MKRLNKENAGVSTHPTERVLQFGGGNFLRGFVDWILDEYNEKTNSDLGVVVVKPTERGDYQEWRDQDGLYHILTKGLKNGEVIDESRLVSCISRIIHPYHDWTAYLATAEQSDIRYIVSNTTESGIRYAEEDSLDDSPPREFPAKLTHWLYHRYEYFDGDPDRGCIIIPTELLIDNGVLLRDTIVRCAEAWELGEGFIDWITSANTFCNTLVDRIVPGVAPDARADAWAAVGYEDQMITQGEPYHLFAIEAPQSVRDELPLDQIGLNIIYTHDLTPYRQLKVRILNGTHTTLVPVAYLYGLDAVRESMEDEVTGAFIHRALHTEILPSLQFPQSELEQFAADVVDRFKNPFIHHRLISISLNSISKFKTRVLPSLMVHIDRGSTPKHLIFSMAALLYFYRGRRGDEEIVLKDDPVAIDFLSDLWGKHASGEIGVNDIIDEVLSWEYAWAQDLRQHKVLQAYLSSSLTSIVDLGPKKALEQFMSL